jgi:hypothetical protein
MAATRAAGAGSSGVAGRFVFIRIVRHDAFLLVGVVARHDGARRLGIAEVDRLVGDVAGMKRKSPASLMTDRRNPRP